MKNTGIFVGLISRLRYFPRTFASGCIVYFVMAACSGASHEGAGLTDAGMNAAQSDGESSRDSSGGGFTDAIADAIANVISDVDSPVPEASAAGPTLDVVSVPCSKSMKYVGVDYTAAEHVYAGKTKTELSGLRVIVPGTGLLVDGYAEYIGGPIYIRDGSAEYLCGPVTNPSTPQSVSFVLPL